MNVISTTQMNCLLQMNQSLLTLPINLKLIFSKTFLRKYLAQTLIKALTSLCNKIITNNNNNHLNPVLSNLHYYTQVNLMHYSLVSLIICNNPFQLMQLSHFKSSLNRTYRFKKINQIMIVEAIQAVIMLILMLDIRILHRVIMAQLRANCSNIKMKLEEMRLILWS